MRGATLKSPYPWFGGKAAIAPLVWDAFGPVRNYVEPFFGGGAVMLAGPWPSARTETINDINAWLCNFWRAVQADPDQVAHYASDPVSELDLHARGDWLFYRPHVDTEFVEQLRSDPQYYCVQSAGWWVWGQCAWIGTGWGQSVPSKRQCVARQRPHLSPGMGVNRQLPHLGNAGMGVNRQLPHLGDAGKGDETTRLVSIRQYMRQLCERMAGVRVCCGDWARVLGPSVTISHGLSGVFLDPPYGVADRDTLYGEDDDRTIAGNVLDWCREWGSHPLMRIVLAGYAGEHDALIKSGWTMQAWKTQGGYGNYAKGGNDNGHRERLWLSPHCLRQECMALEQ